MILQCAASGSQNAFICLSYVYPHVYSHVSWKGAPAKAVHETHFVSLLLGGKALMQLVEAVLQNPPCPTLTPSTSS